MKNLACAALGVLASVLLLTTPLDAKGGGGGHGGGHGFSGRGHFHSARPNIGPLARRGYPIPRNIGPLAGHYLASRYHHGHHQHHRHGNDFAWDYGYYGSSYGYGYGAPYAALIDDGSSYTDLPPPRIATPVIRTVENSKDVCKAESVKVPASRGGETTVTILRC